MTLQDSAQIAAGIHRIAYPFAVVFAAWQSRRAINHNDYPEAAWWAWVTTICVLIG